MGVGMYVPGRVENTALPVSRALMPLFEAIVNSLQAIDDAGTKAGRVVVRMLRDHSQEALRPSAKTDDPIRGYEIRDNGIGFNAANFKSFETADSRFKLTRGGKGIGRILWLKAFQVAEVESVFEDTGKKFRRTFLFRASDEAIEKHELTEVPHVVPVGTVVRLLRPKSEYHGQFPKAAETLALRVIEHCVGFLVHTSAPGILVEDEATGESTSVNDVFRNCVLASESRFQVDGAQFKMRHLRVTARHGSMRHLLCYCGNGRTVTSEALEALIPNVRAELRDGETGKPFVYQGYVFGKTLDDHTTSDRSGFAFGDDPDLTGDDRTTWRAIRDASKRSAAKFLEPLTEEIQRRKEAQIESFVQESPQYRVLLRHKPDSIQNIPPDLSSERLDVELYKVLREYDQELKEDFNALVKESSNPNGLAEHKAWYERWLQEWGDRGISQLAEYVSHRKATLEFLKVRMGQTGNGKFHLEEAIHEVVFPLRRTSDEVPIEQQNLWMLDERLAFHRYLASDKYLDGLPVAEIEAHKRVDLLVFQNAFLMAEGPPPAMGAVTIIEFKRPMRDDYTAEDNPIDQVFGYIEDIREGKARLRDGRLVPSPESPVHAIIVCDVTPKLRRQLDGGGDFTTAVPSHHYYRWHKNLRAFIELMSFDLMIDNAERRNRILFEKLGINNVAVNMDRTEVAVRSSSK